MILTVALWAMGAVLVVVVSVTSSLDQPVLQAAAVLAMCGAFGAALSRHVRGVPTLIVALLSALTFSSLLPLPAALVVQVAAIVVPFALWVARGGLRSSTRWVVLAVVITLAVWTALVFHPNVPDLIVGLEGWRKSVLALVGVVLGCAAVARRAVEDLVIGLLVVALGVSLVAHLWLTPIESYIARDAAIYTGEFGGVERLQGVFAGPFHVAQAAVLVIGWAGIRFMTRRVLASFAVAVGLAAIAFAMVRTAFVALAAVVLCVALVYPMTRRLRIGILSGAAAAVVTAGLLAWTGALGPAAASLFTAATDGRLLNRFPGYGEAVTLFVQSPWWGWGAGSAGDTLGRQFEAAGLAHVTSHNILLKVVVEGGLVGLVAWVFVAVVLWRTVSWRTGAGRVALVSLVGLAVFGVVGSSLEALPVTYLLFVLVGLACRHFRPLRLGPVVGPSISDVSISGR